MNLSELSRKSQVLAYLKARTGLWVDGSELATAEVGGSEGLRRLRELRDEDGYNIQTRSHPDPDRDINQYRIVPGKAKVAEPVDRTQDDSAPSDSALSAQTIPHRPPVDHVREGELRRKVAAQLPPDDQTAISSAVRRKEDGTFEYVPPQAPLVEPDQLTIPAPDPEQPPGAKFSSLPAKIDYGTVAICPRCRSKTTRGRTKKEAAKDAERPTMVVERRRKKSDDGSMPLVDEDGVLLFRDPHSRKAKPCERCNGYGIVPNAGPISLTMPGHGD